MTRPSWSLMTIFANHPSEAATSRRADSLRGPEAHR
jgi:hypothetical protein